MTFSAVKATYFSFVKTDKHDVLISFLLSFFALLPLLIRGPLDQEEYDLGIFSGRFAFEALWKGSLGLWLPELGFGTPMPIGQSFGSYPPFGLLNLIGMSTFFCIFWLTQLWLGTYFMFRLCRQLEIEHTVAIVAAISFVLSKPTMNYSMTDEWPTAFFTWTLYPVIIFLLTALLLNKDGLRSKKILMLGLALGLWLSKSHPGHVSLLLIPMAIYALVLMPWLNMKIICAFIIACLIAFLVSLDTFAFIYNEASLFPSGLVRNTQPGYSLVTYLLTLFYPIASPQGYTIITGVEQYLRNHFSRGPFFGTLFMLSAMCSLWITLGLNRWRVATGLAFVIAFILSMLDTSVSKVFSGLWLARDPLILFGILTAAMLLTSLAKLGTIFHRRIVAFLLLGQIIHVLLGFIPLIAHTGFRLNLSESSNHRFHYFGESTPSKLKTWLTDSGNRKGQRFFLSNKAQDAITHEWQDQGIYGNTDLVRLGLPVVTGWFKNISMDPIYPSAFLMHGRINGDTSIIENKSFFDVAGIRWLLVKGNEVPSYSKNNKFKPPLLFFGSNEKSLALLENPDAWPMAVFIDPTQDFLNKFPRASGCNLEGIACANLEVIRNARKDGHISVQIEHEQIILRFSPNQTKRQIFLSFFSHNGWVARAEGRELQIQKIGGAFMKIIAPSGVSEIKLNYNPTWRKMAMIISLASGIIVATLLILVTLKLPYNHMINKIRLFISKCFS